MYRHTCMYNIQRGSIVSSLTFSRRLAMPVFGEQDKSHALFLYMCVSLNLGTWRAEKMREVMENPISERLDVKSRNYLNRFQNWLQTVSVTNACKWYLKWNVLWPVAYIVIVVIVATLITLLGDDAIMALSDDDTLSFILVILIAMPLIISSFVFNYIVTERIMCIKKTTLLSCIFSNAFTISMVLFMYGSIDPYLKYAFPFLNSLPMILMVIFFCVIYQYAYEVYRTPVLFAILASTINAGGTFILAKEIVKEDSPIMIFLGGLTLVLGLVSYILLYKTAKRYNM